MAPKPGVAAGGGVSCAVHVGTLRHDTEWVCLLKHRCVCLLLGVLGVHSVAPAHLWGLVGTDLVVQMHMGEGWAGALTSGELRGVLVLLLIYKLDVE